MGERGAQSTRATVGKGAVVAGLGNAIAAWLDLSPQATGALVAGVLVLAQGLGSWARDALDRDVEGPARLAAYVLRLCG